MPWEPDNKVLQNIPAGQYEAECTDAKFYPEREGKPCAFQLVWALAAGVNGTEDPPPLSDVTEYVNFHPPSEAKKHKGVLIQLRRFAKATGRTAPTGLTDENVPEWQEFFVGAKVTMTVAYDDTGEYTRLRY